jgi:hypothetical protein
MKFRWLSVLILLIFANYVNSMSPYERVMKRDAPSGNETNILSNIRKINLNFYFFRLIYSS